MNAITGTKRGRFSKDRQFLNEISASGQPPRWAVKFQCSLAADKQRVYQALTAGEFLESWICLPCCSCFIGNDVSEVPGGFVLEHVCARHESNTTIIGRYQVLRSRRVVFSWVPSEDRFPRRGGDVKILLCGDYERTRLRLHQGGFESFEQCQWQNNLWISSLERLCALFEPPLVAPQRTLRDAHPISKSNSLDS